MGSIKGIRAKLPVTLSVVRINIHKKRKKTNVTMLCRIDEKKAPVKNIFFVNVGKTKLKKAMNTRINARMAGYMAGGLRDDEIPPVPLTPGEYHIYR
ncbi:MAG: hypothetical protein K8T10_02025 [Candidatus Eremiobacteraeota bacterium]|nr:hypothetical protein [Candidatus Eremiobacteraeota bacterium]